ncbi:peptidylprolyl isomerase [Nocardioides sp. S5]|uniref:SurA N-terminal domain-containing protein n=1 Tax=Nocardioides sp. S5 TaxID=2017486 RepID=UPI001A8CA8AC|nr:SurA N-terminal domain-containing protein [Nocardioides sp. S5]QSR29431.1 peptidylprolyl isomerase [Nocardioides sp. S5]
MTHTMRTHRTRTSLGALAVAAVLTLSACGGGDGSSADADASAATSSDSEQSDAGAGIPDVVAEVNGEEVTKDEFVPIYEAQLEQATAQSQMTGEAPDEEALKQATLDDLVDTELLAQEAEARGIEVTDEDVDTELTSLAEQNGMKTGEELLAAIAQQGMDEETARAQVETQVLVEQLVEDESGPFEPTEKELRAIYDDAKKQQAQSEQGGQQIPPFAQVRSQLVEQARAQETGSVAGALVEDLREAAEITVNL